MYMILEVIKILFKYLAKRLGNGFCQ